MMTLEAENKPSSIIFIPKKRKEIDEDSQPDQTPCSIKNIVLSSHCSRALLSKSNYIIELDPQAALLLNNSWNLNPMAAKSCAHLLEEEAVCLERNKSLFVLGGEIHSRRLSSLDAHYEKRSSTKRNIPQSSLPRTDTRYNTNSSQPPKYAEILIPSECRCCNGISTLKVMLLKYKSSSNTAHEHSCYLNHIINLSKCIYKQSLKY
ncbi:hypothetical protein PS15m_010307 [Mucor circinelloides]